MIVKVCTAFSVLECGPILAAMTVHMQKYNK